eukprot:4975086-Lingulodinium_polyedra.AAC.1
MANPRAQNSECPTATTRWAWRGSGAFTRGTGENHPYNRPGRMGAFRRRGGRAQSPRSRRWHGGKETRRPT